ncbi:hypothetical protein ABB37_00887 [Leptomonas pyrrhocoris]|uniref:Uncharacterized protein n=1 Tax=Leptomonas pyrrhocoris TaxID=157538 RepID=A0A0N0VHZ7_LEPPY|nr:hypothetical protein ABB37_00887 [Leptomonas pyrrhocoris]XP_015665273.1 hypothetical protein ABB37_00887 [Leptomonas pyrrhocoris]KPA86833.1 hypothetical protein ABB37_00887 [Leptomonas pyrrhocoris]KPA86834.1 hypothetical protein ABB37_00887 [Leptomonas pyrrhocoris]|eukprot:XP_015665272.1 hypothetical protein ABB37_00887 [Leptomonas pyrrhocoris]
MPPPSRRSAAPFRPFLSSSLDEYLRQYWAVVFTVGAQAIDTGHMRHYLAWYATRLKVVELDHHLYARTLRDQLIAKSGTAALPLLFVNQKVVGTIADVRSYEERRLLKDIVQFGFQWRTGAGVGGAPQPLNTLPSAYRDTELFRGRYRGAPIARPVVQLPQLHPYHNEKD